MKKPSGSKGMKDHPGKSAWIKSMGKRCRLSRRYVRRMNRAAMRQGRREFVSYQAGQNFGNAKDW